MRKGNAAAWSFERSADDGARTLRSQNYAHALRRLAVVQARSSGDVKLAKLFARGVRDPAAHSVEERIQFT